ncbi:MAG: M48 family metallopeptidase [Rickettsiales bacterium]|jgi:predicted metal-dependent hydrolase|nr:M48 family metallopeptidase [Rickettsiales bacterium]
MKIRDGDLLNVLGQEWRIDAREIGGAPEFLDRRVRDIAKRRMLAAAKSIIREMPADMRPARITLRDTRSRWGSCSATRAMSLSYRLAFAPVEIMRYVVIHECCHLREMNHGPAFWRLVETHSGPGFKTAKKWLNKNSRGLFAI